MRNDSDNNAVEIEICDYITAELVIPMPLRDRDATRDVRFKLQFNLFPRTPGEVERQNEIEKDGGLEAVVRMYVKNAECLTPNQVFKRDGEVISAAEWLAVSPIGQDHVIKKYWDKIKHGIRAKN